MIDTKLAALRINVSRETGEIMLLINTECGLRPVMCWPDVNNLQDFARTLLGICGEIQGKDIHSRSFPADEWLDNIYNGNC